MMTKPNITQTEITIVGAGLIGLSAALSLSKLGFDIHILENHLPEPASRPISLSYGSYRILEALGVWHTLADSACPILSVHVSEQGRFGTTRFSAKEQKVPALGYVVPFEKLQAALYQHAAEQPNIHFHMIESIEQIHCDSQSAQIQITKINTPAEIHTKLLIAADGTRSTCRDLLQIPSDEKTSGDTARIYQLTLADDHTHTAYERFTAFGVLAVLPLPDKKRAQCVWTLTPRLSKKISQWNDEAIVAFFKSVFDTRLVITAAKKIVELPLQTVIAKKQVTESAILLGNAAHTIYPVAAQGFNLGLHDIAVLYDVLSDAKKNQQRLGDLTVLTRYESAAKHHQETIYKITNQLISLFELPLIGSLRGLGLLATDLLHPFKNALAKRTMGIAGKLSKIMRGRR